MSAYLIANVNVHTQEIYESYRQHTAGTVEKYGGKFIVRGGECSVIEGAWQPVRLIVIEFSTMKTLKEWYNSEEYQTILPARQNGANSEVVFVEGFNPVGN